MDESGGFEAPDRSPDATPVMLIVGVVLDHRVLQPLTRDFLAVKSRYYPTACYNGPGHNLDRVRTEIKGSKVRESLRSDARRKRSHGFGYVDRTVELLERYDARIIGRLWVKEPSTGLNPQSSYTFAIQDIARHFNALLLSANDMGLMVCDGRRYTQDAEVSHSVFTQKHQVSGDSLPALVETPVFGRSESHPGIQLADAVASALLFPMATRTYCATTCTSSHAHPRFDEVKKRYASRLKALRFTYTVEGKPKGGIVVSDKVGQLPSGRLFTA